MQNTVAAADQLSDCSDEEMTDIEAGFDCSYDSGFQKKNYDFYFPKNIQKEQSHQD